MPVVNRDQTNIPVELTINKGGGVTGLTVTVSVHEKLSSRQYDFDDDTFKTPGTLTTPTVSAPAVDPTNLPGKYAVSGGFDLNAATNLAAGETQLEFRFTFTGPEDGVATKTFTISENAYDPAVETNAVARQVTNIAEHDDTQADIAAQTAAIQGAGGPTLAAMAGAGFVSGTDSLEAAQVQRTGIQTDIDNFENITRFKVSIPILERPEAGTTLHEIYFNLKDDQGLPVNADGLVTIQATSFGGVSGDRNARLGGTTMANLATGRYRQTFSVADSDILEGIAFFLSWSEGGNANNVDKSEHVVDSNEVGYLASDRARDNQIALETAAIDGRLPSDPADESNQLGAHTTTQAAIALLETEASAAARAATNQTEHDDTQLLINNLENLSIADVQTAMDNQGYTAARADLLDNLDELVSAAKTLTPAERVAVATAILGELITNHNGLGTVGGALAAAWAHAGGLVVDDMWNYVGAPPGQPASFRRRQFATAAEAILARATPNAPDGDDNEVKRWKAVADYTGVTATDTLIAMHFIEEL